jgi:hypothetical protein
MGDRAAVEAVLGQVEPGRAARRAALDAVAAIRTIESEEDGTPPNLPDEQPGSLLSVGGTARVRWAGPSRQSPARERRTRRRRRRLDPNYGLIRQLLA